MKKIKLVFILPSLNGGGSEKVSINYMRQLESSKYDLTIITFKKSNELLSLIPSYVKIIDLDTNSTRKSIFKLIENLKQISPDIVYTTHSRVSAFLMFIKVFVPKFYHIARMQSTPSLEKKYGEYGVKERIFYSLGFKNSDTIIAQTDDMKKDAVKTFKLNEKNIEVMNNPLDKLYIDECVIKSINPFTKDKITAVVSGRIKKEKGYDLVISAMKDILSKCSNFQLHILGYDEGEKENLIKLSKLHDVEKSIFFHDFIANPYAFYSNCDLFILSSYREGFPNAMLENYYLNTPIVATTCVPIVATLIENGKNGYLCNVGDVECLSINIIKCIEEIKRENILNPKYNGANLENLLKKRNLI